MSAVHNASAQTTGGGSKADYLAWSLYLVLLAFMITFLVSVLFFVSINRYAIYQVLYPSAQVVLLSPAAGATAAAVAYPTGS